MALRLALALVLCLLCCTPAWATRQKLQGWCQDGGTEVLVSGTPGSDNQRFQQTFRSCTVTVYAAGTLTLATLYSDAAGTAQANPFTASALGRWSFYADGGRYDIRFSGGGISTPFTLGDWKVDDAVVNCKDYGATGDGTTNDTTALQRCITAASAGSTILLPGGTYLITTTLSMATGNVRLTGEGQDGNAAIHFNAASTLPLIRLETGSIRIDHLMLRGDGTASGGGIDATNTGILASKTGDAAFADFDLYVEQVTFSRLANGIDYRGRNLTVTASIFSHVKDGILCTGATAPSGGNRGCVVQNSRFHSMGSTHASGTRSHAITFPGAAQNFSEALITGNYVDDCEQFVTGNVRSVVITDNTITRQSPNIAVIDIDNTGNGGQSQSSIISNNQMSRLTSDTTTGWTSQHGIVVTGAYYTVVGNTIVKMGGNGLRIAATNVVASNNLIINPGYGNPTGAMAAILVSAANNLVTNNYCLRDDTTNSGMTYCVDPGANAIYLGPYFSSGAVTNPINIDTTNTSAIDQFRLRLASNTAGTTVISMGDGSTVDTRIRDDGFIEYVANDVAIWSSAAKTIAIRDVDGATQRITFNGDTGAAVLLGINWSDTLFASLPGSPSNGMQRYCSDCTVTGAGDNTCTSGGTGAFAYRINGVWRCFNNQN